MRTFITFGGPTINYHKAVERICKEANCSQMFDNVIGLTDVDLKKDARFWERHRIFIEANKRGYGYWIWKPYIIMNQLKQMKENDILIYADAGCTINTTEQSKRRMSEYIEMINRDKSGMLSFQMQFPENKYTKMDIINHFNYKHNDGQLVGTAFILRKCKQVEKMVRKWYKTCCIYDLVNDSPSTHPNASWFVANRHDQSIWSIIRKKYGSVIIPDETYYIDWDKDGDNVPIWATRLR